MFFCFKKCETMFSLMHPWCVFCVSQRKKRITQRIMRLFEYNMSQKSPLKFWVSFFFPLQFLFEQHDTLLPSDLKIRETCHQATNSILDPMIPWRVSFLTYFSKFGGGDKIRPVAVIRFWTLTSQPFRCVFGLAVGRCAAHCSSFAE